MTTRRIVAIIATTLALCAPVSAQSFGDWNRKITSFSMTPSATMPGSCDVSVDWQFEVLTAGFIPGDLTTELVLHINGIAVASAVQSASDIGAPAGGGDPNLCPVAICSGSCGFVLLDTTTAPMTCTERLSVCRCQSAPLTHVFPGVSFASGDEIMVLLRPAPGALPDPNADDDSAMITFASWNRRMAAMNIEPTAGPDSFYDITATWLVDLEDASSFDQEIGVEIDLVINGITVATNTTEDCLIWDIDTSGGDCSAFPDGTSCGTAVLSGSTADPACDGGHCSAGPLTSTFPGVPLQPEDEILVILRPAPGALPEPDTSDDLTRLTFGSWNRRVRSIVPQPAAGLPDNFFDVWVEWTMDFEGAADLPAELGVELTLHLNGVPVAMNTSEDCILWDIMNSGGGNGDCAAAAEACGDLVHNGQTEQAAIDPPFGSCSSLPLTSVFPGVPLSPGDEIMVLLRPAPGALPDADETDDIGMLEFGSWNRRLVSVQVEHSPTGGPDTYDVTAEVVLEISSSATNVLVPMGVATEPYAADACCEDACCCPACSCTAEGCTATTDDHGEFWFIGLEPGNLTYACDGACDAPCGQVCEPDATINMICDPDDCVCRSESLFLHWEAVPVDPDGGLTVKLVPVPGALPELPGFPDDDEETVPLPPRPCEHLGDCADTDDDGIRDNGCVWWECVAGECLDTAIMFADMGGQFGSCPPDGTADNNDRNIALNCFSNVDNEGNPGAFPCEPHPNYPGTAYNTDAGGQFGSCGPDGACDGNDAFAALNAFAGATTCSCAMGPEPAGPGAPIIVDAANLRLTPRRATLAGGDAVEVDVFLTTGLKDLRGYQLHAGVSGGTRGTLELVDVSISSHDSRMLEKKTVRRAGNRGQRHLPHVFDGLGDWRAFNLMTRQVLAGLDTPGVATGPGYLATFTFRATRDARGAFVIDLLHDDSDPQQRTFLFPTLPNGKIEIEQVKPAVVEIK